MCLILRGLVVLKSCCSSEMIFFVSITGSVIKGWEIGVLTMKKGEVCIVTCQPDYAYGKAGSTKIPPNTPLQFEIELINWRGEDVSSDGNVMKAVLKKGIGHDRPNVGATVDGN